MAGKTPSNKPKKGGEVDRVYQLIKGWILSCRFRPGEFLPEVEVAVQCKTSRTPVREACNRLSEEKWLSKIQNKGYLVTPVSVQDIVEVYQFRRLLEGFTAERTAQTVRDEDLAALREIAAVEARPNVKLAAIVEANYAFHSRVGKLAQNQRIYDQLIFTLQYVHRLDILSTVKDATWVPHDAIMAALEKRDPRAAYQAMTEHVDASRDRMLRVFFRGELPHLQSF